MPKPVSLLRAVVISPGDVLAERNAVEKVLKEVNRDTARPAELHIELWRWEDFTLLGGLQAVGAKLPLLVLGGFGGIAGEVWEVLQGQRSRFASDEEVQHMAGRAATPEWAETCVRSLAEQTRRRDALQIWRA